MDGIITQIQNYSLHDGPGIRTTVFLKGCNMNCPWCHNPETYHMFPQIYYKQNLCLHCNRCINACPNNAIEISNDSIETNSSCNMCGTCCESCVNEAIEIVGNRISTKEVVSLIEEDYHYYIDSGGGVTLSGGEVLLQKEFALEVLKTCKEKKIHTCIESNMSLPYELCEDLLTYCDMVIMDIKLFDDEKHKYWTGVSNKYILDNYLKLSNNQKPVIVRTPVISGVNDNVNEIMAIANFIRGNPNLIEYQLLDYHNLGEMKRKGLGMDNNHVFTMVSETKMKTLREIANSISS